jgi:hypothetical protein
MTKKQPKRSTRDDDYLIGGMEVLLDAMSGISPGTAIEAQESREQSRVCNRQMLPRYESPTFAKKDAKPLYEKAGIKILNEADDLFYSVQLPEGWKIEPTGHSMWNNVLDAKGRLRFVFFYKGAFYDRDATVGTRTRYKIDYDLGPELVIRDFYERREKEVKFYRVKEGETVLFEASQPYFGKTNPPLCRDNLGKDPNWSNREWFNAFDLWEKQQWKECEDWLDEHFPGWKDPFAYWD